MRFQNVKILLRWPSRMHIYGFVENCTFLEQFDSMGVTQHSFKYDGAISLNSLTAQAEFVANWVQIPVYF